MTTPDRTCRRARQLLICSAVILSLLILLTIGRTPEPQVHAGMTASDDAYTMMTGPAKTGASVAKSDLLYIIDNHSGILLAYRPQVVGAGTRIVLVDGGFLDQLFSPVQP